MLRMTIMTNHDYIDLDARLRNAQAEEARHLQILKRARRSKTYSRAQRNSAASRVRIEQLQGEEIPRGTDR